MLRKKFSLLHPHHLLGAAFLALAISAGSAIAEPGIWPLLLEGNATSGNQDVAVTVKFNTIGQTELGKNAAFSCLVSADQKYAASGSLTVGGKVEPIVGICTDASGNAAEIIAGSNEGISVSGVRRVVGEVVSLSGHVVPKNASPMPVDIEGTVAK